VPLALIAPETLAGGLTVIPASLLNFLSGLTAGAGINMLTSLEGGSAAGHGAIVIDSTLWVLVAVALAYAAHLSEGVEREAALVIDGNLSPEEKKIIYKDEASRVSRGYKLSLSSGGALTLLATIFIPGLLYH
jgi:hypothetical protein